MPASNVIEVVVKVVDQATRGLAAVQTRIKTLDASVRKMMPSLSGAAKNLLAFAGVTGGIYAVGAAFRKMIGAIEADENATAQLEAGIKSTGGVAGYTTEQLREMAAEFQNVTRYGDEAINQMQSVLLTFTQIRGVEFKEATLQIANLASRLKVDLQAAALQVGKALNDPVLGVSMLSRAGIQFTATQKKMIKELVDANKFVEAQKIVLAELETQFGGSAEAARNTLGGALEAVRNRFADLFEASQDTVQPATEAMNQLEQTLASPGMKGGFQALIAAMIKAVEWAAKLAGYVGQVVSGIQVMTGTTGDDIEDLNFDIERLNTTIENLQRRRAGFKFGTPQVVADINAALDRDIAKFTKRRDEYLKLQGDLIDGGGKTATPKGKDVALRLQPDTEDKIQKAINGTLTSYEKQRAAILAARKELTLFIDQYAKVDKATRDKAGVTEELFAGAQAALAKTDEQLSNLDFNNKLDGLQEVGVTAKRVFDGISEQTKTWNNDTKTELERASDEWKEFVFKLDTLLARGAISPAVYATRYNEGLKNSIEEVKVSSQRIKVELDQLSVSGKRAAENIQDAFADFFMNLDGGFKGLVRSINNVIKQTLANLLAARVVKLLNIEGLIAKIEAPFKKAAQKAAQEWFEKVSIGGPPEKGKTTTAETGERAKKQVEAWEVSKRKADEATKTAIEKQTGDLEEVIVQSNAKISEAMLKQDPCACIRKLGETLSAAIKDCCAKAGDTLGAVIPRGYEVTIPEVTMPDIVMPEIVMPDVVVPEIVVPEIQAPDVNIPDIVVPPIQAPDVVIPDIVVPEIAAPEVTIPEIVMPQVVVPDITVPEIAAPEVIIPDIVMPQMPDVVVPPIEVPPAVVTVNVDMDAVVAAIEKSANRNNIPSESGTVGAIQDAMNQVIPRMQKAATNADQAAEDMVEATTQVTTATRESAGRLIEATRQATQILATANKAVEDGLARVFQDVGKMLDITLGNMARYLGTLLGTLIKKSGGSKGGIDFGSIAKMAISWYAGGANGGSEGGFPVGRAGGGMIPAMAGGGIVRVGEEGPELVALPTGSEVINKRQQMYRGMAQPTLNYQPSYTIVIENASDAKATQDQLDSLLKSRDRRLRNEIISLLKDNGYGRLQ